MEAEVAASRLIDSARTMEPLRLTALLTDIGIDLETMCLSDLTAILVALKTELDSGRHPSQLVERMLFAAPFAKPHSTRREANDY